MSSHRSWIRRRKSGGDGIPPPLAPPTHPPSLERFVVEHGSFVRRALLRAGVAEANLDDAAQQVFLVAASKRAVVTEGSERAFLLGVVLNIAAHARRQIARRREVDDHDVIEDRLDDAPPPDEALDAQRLSSLVEELLDALPIDLRAVLVLVDIEDRTMADAAEQLGIPRGTVASRLRRAREIMASAVGRARPSQRLRAARGRRFS